ncbi:MAG: ACT domain-containing protein [Pseudomonadota bacterium]
MTKTLVLTFIAKDRPGLVERLAQAVAGQGGNWLESRMVRLAEKFVGVARVEAPKGKIAALRDALLALNAEGFHLTVEETAEGAAPKDRLLVLDLVGPDHPGIVRDISHCLAMRGVSVEEMETDIRAAPMGGGFLFYAKARVRVPPALSERELSDALHTLGNTLMVDVSLGGG